ncbi:phenylalanine--tRNA ligase subunit beta [Candidatus Margulisiibacteriota bacterium]
MLAPITWLRDFVDINCDAEELARKLTMSSFEIEQIIYPAKEISGVVVGRIERIEKHPNADKLRICWVDVAKGGEEATPPQILRSAAQNDVTLNQPPTTNHQPLSTELLKIVTGAANVEEGDIVPIATIGAELVGGFTIKPVKLRGEDSFGMLCSEKELGLADEAEGIMQLPKDAPVGEDFKKYLGLDDAVLDISILPNRPDCMSMIGVAREVAAVLGNELKGRPAPPQILRSAAQNDVQQPTTNHQPLTTKITVQSPNLCPRYMGQVMNEVTIKESPLWLKQRLSLSGIRPINNVVDITNYVLLEHGQPMHAFDLEKINGDEGQKQIVIRRAGDGEKIQTLDETEKELSSDNMVIADSKGTIALAGVMGGAGSEISEGTTAVFLESAFFNPVSVRKTAMKLGYRTESSARFERGVEWNCVEAGLRRAIEMLKQFADAKPAGEIIDVFERAPETIEIAFRPQRINKVLGMDLPESEITDGLASLGFEFSDGKVIVPSWRDNDVTREADIVEEVARITGYDKLPATLPKSGGVDLLDLTGESFIENVRQCLTGQGLNEITTFSLVSPEMTAPEKDRAVKVANPLNNDESILRTCMLPGILKVLQLNMSRQIDDVRIFEAGKIYLKGASQQQYVENERLTVAILNKNTDYYGIKGVLENLLEALKVEGAEFVTVSEANDRETATIRISEFHPGKTAIIKLGDQVLGVCGQIHPAVLDKYKFNTPVLVFDLDLGILKDQRQKAAYKPFSRFPSSTQDIAFMVKKETAHKDIVTAIRSASNYLVENIELFDRYEGDPVPEGWVSMAYSITYRDPEKTLVEKEVIEVHKKIAQAIEDRFEVKFR